VETLPYAWYSDPEILRREEEAIFRRTWQYVGHAGQVAEPGSYATGRAGHVPVLLTRARDGELRAFLNVCRHRGSQLADGDGRRETIQCAYHAWTYDLDGSLRAAPRGHELDLDGVGLVALRLDTWGPLVFVNPDADAAPLAETLGDLPEQVDVDDLVFHHRAESTQAANWKVCVENYLECYHCPVAHPGLTKVVDVAPERYRLEEARLYSSQVAPEAHFHFLWPNLTINVGPGEPNLSIGPVLPDGPERTARFLDYFFAPDADEAWIAEYLEWDDQVGREDTALVERVQRGVRSGVLEAGRLLPESERLIAHFDGLVREAVGGS
jgi:choline monooxygenase